MNGVACAQAAPKNGLAIGKTAGKRRPDPREVAPNDRGIAPVDSKHIPFIS